MSEKKPKNIFTSGHIPATFIAERIQKHRTQTGIGAHSIFLGQVRSDGIDSKKVTAIEYTTYKEMAIEKCIKYAKQFHSLGTVAAGEICLFVFTSAKHRKAAIDACEETVERIKAELPVWGKDLFEDATYQRKVNK